MMLLHISTFPGLELWEPMNSTFGFVPTAKGKLKWWWVKENLSLYICEFGTYWCNNNCEYFRCQNGQEKQLKKVHRQIQRRHGWSELTRPKVRGYVHDVVSLSSKRTSPSSGLLEAVLSLVSVHVVVVDVTRSDTCRVSMIGITHVMHPF